MDKYVKMAELDTHISSHLLRHTKAMHLLEAGINIFYIKDLLGHEDISTVEIYYGKKKLMTSCTDGSAYLQRYPPEQLSIINASGH